MAKKSKTWNPGVGQGGSVNLFEALVKAYPDADRDLLKHYAAVKEMNTIQRMFYPLGKELTDWTGHRSTTGFSWDDMGANLSAMRYTPDEAYDRGLFKHTEGIDWQGVGQGMFTEVLRKLISREYQPTNNNVPKNSGLAEYPHLQKYKN